MAALATLGPWGLLVPALASAAYLAWCLGAAVFQDAPLRVRAAAGFVLTLALFTFGMQLLMYLGLVRRTLLVILLGAAVVVAHRLARRHARARPVTPRKLTLSLVPLLLVTGFGLGLAVLAAYFLPVWQWDSLGYHLPFVNFVLQGGGLSELPVDVPYLSTYPRNVELLFAALRAMLPDDRLIDIGQIPLGIAGAVATSAIARELGAGRPEALAAGSAWLLLPAVYLQLPTNYIDVGVAAFFLLAAFFLMLPATRATLLCAGLAIGLFLGTKPNAPPPAALLALVLVVRGARAKLLGAAIVGVLASGLLGLEAYVTNIVRHGNPVWPAIVDLGPVHLPGTISVKELLSSGAGTQKVYGSLAARVFQSWTSFDSMPIFDMRVGGLSPIFWLAVPGALFLIFKKRLVLLPSLMLIALVTPDPAVVRYVLPMPALVLAGACASLSFVPEFARATAHALLAVLSAFNLHYAAPGLIGEGPPLTSYAKMSWPEREVAVGANGRPEAFVAARNQLAPGEVAVYDKSLWLPYLMWRSDLSNRVVRVPDDSTLETTERLLCAPEVRLIAAGNDQSTRSAIMRRAAQFKQLFRCREECEVYFRN